MPFSELAPFVAAAIRDPVLEQMQKELDATKAENAALKARNSVAILKSHGQIMATGVIKAERRRELIVEDVDPLALYLPEQYVVRVEAVKLDVVDGRHQFWFSTNNPGHNDMQLAVDGEKVTVGWGGFLRGVSGGGKPNREFCGYGKFSPVPKFAKDAARKLLVEDYGVKELEIIEAETALSPIHLLKLGATRNVVTDAMLFLIHIRRRKQ